MVMHGKGSILEDVRMHRTKCAGLIKNVIPPTLKSDLIEDLSGKKYTLIVDESTDISLHKHLCILVRYFSDKKSDIVTTFLSLIHVLKAAGGNIFNLIEEEITRSNQSLANCIGFASDGASAMVGCKNSVWSRPEKVSPQCVQLKCTCHSLALCVQYAVSKLPSTIGFLLSEILRWFCNSEIRREAYKKLLTKIRHI